MNAPVPIDSLRIADPTLPAFRVEGRDRLFLRSGTARFGDEREVRVTDLVAGEDYRIWLDAQDMLVALPYDEEMTGGELAGGFHFAPGGNAPARAGGDTVPAINPFSVWDTTFRPTCPDPRGMFSILLPNGERSWIDIYKLGVDHIANGTSRYGVTIADGDDLPIRPGGSAKVARLDFPTAQDILAHHGKQLLTYDEFRVAAFGVTEKTAAPRDPKVTGLDAPRTSAFGMIQATGNLWDWGSDGDPDVPRASIFGGSWWHGDFAGSRYADLGYWPGRSGGSLSARGRCDHLTLE